VTETLGNRPPARERLLAAAGELFYAEGIHTVGIDRVIDRAGVAKASLYSSFGSKDELIRGYLMRWHERIQEEMTARIAGHDDPRSKLLAMFDHLVDACRDPAFRGCPFLNANAESQPGSAAAEVAELSRAWRWSLVLGLLNQIGAADPESLARQLIMLEDGAMVATRLDHNPASAEAARSAAKTLIDAAARA